MFVQCDSAKHDIRLSGSLEGNWLINRVIKIYLQRNCCRVRKIVVYQHLQKINE